MTFYVGQKVVCVDDSVHPEWNVNPDFRYCGDLDGLKRGLIYTIRRVGYDKIDGDPVIWLQEIIRTEWPLAGESGFHQLRFRPLTETEKQTDISVFREILDRVKKLETTTA